MTKPDHDIIERLVAADDPRTPLHFKKLHRFGADDVALESRDAECAFHRTTGYLSGATAVAPKPISRVFSEPRDD